jgi:hypothetical protein
MNETATHSGRRRLAVSASVVISAGLLTAVTGPVGAQEATGPATSSTAPAQPPPAYAIRAEPTTDVRNGAIVRITVGVPGGPGIAGVDSSLCRQGPGGSGVYPDEAWGHECVGGGMLGATRVSDSEFVITHRALVLDWTFSGPAYPVHIVCDDTHPCTIGVRIAPVPPSRVPGRQYAYAGVTINFASGEHAETTTTTTPRATTTTTLSPAARRNLLAVFVYVILCRLFIVGCPPP